MTTDTLVDTAAPAVSRSGRRRRRARTPRERAGRITAVVALALLGLLVLGAIWIGARGALAAWHLDQAQQKAGGLQATLVENPAAASATIAELRDDARAARELTSDPLWSLAQGLPWIGPQLTAVATVAAALDDVASDVAAPLADAAPALLAALSPADGRIDLAALEAAQPVAVRAAGVAHDASLNVAALPVPALVGPLRSAVEQGSGVLEQLDSATDALARALVLLPPMLGADGPRTVLAIVENNAEWRSLGGLAGSLVELRTDDGAVALGEQASATSLTQYAAPLDVLPAELDPIYDGKPGRFAHNVTQIPDFAIAAQLAQRFWQNDHDVAADAVVALDAVALSYLLAATGDVTLSTGDTVGSGNAVSFLLSEVYERYDDPAAQDAVFEETTSLVFAALFDGRADAAELLNAFVRAGAEGRFLVWNDDPALQSVLDSTTLQGALPASDAGTTAFGVYLNDGTGSKLDYHLAAGASAAWCTRVDGGLATAALRVDLRSDVPADVGSLAPYVTGAGDDGLTVGGTVAGDARTVAYVYLPTDANVQRVRVSAGTATPVGFHDGHAVVQWDVVLGPGEAAHLELVASGTAMGEDLDIAMTPTLHETETSSVGAACATMP
ncbi:DUF4012 domain-containing protein [Microbacterium gilvum]|uniref:DUF4012 domain-containing protein n=1 Tax=Microbacterium gilvum TaxID=1336204 RepID=A0ABP9AB17_9MICO